MFYHTLLSDWNHGNAHFLRGIMRELLKRGHDVQVYEPENSWSLSNLLVEYGQKPIRKFRAIYPGLESVRYNIQALDLEKTLQGADLILVHEWSDHDLVRRIGEYRKSHSECRILFHDTHHRMVTDPASMSAYKLEHYDGVLAYGKVLEDLYKQSGRVRNVWTWHEAADTDLFHPLPETVKTDDFVWIGNWGDEERTAEIYEYLIGPMKELRLKSKVYGVRYPEAAQQSLREAGIEYKGWIPNFEVPSLFAAAKATVHIPRRPYVQALPGIPTIRPFEALACGIPLICSPWTDSEKLFRPGQDYLIANNGAEMKQKLRDVIHDEQLAGSLRQSGLEQIRARHTCSHRVEELLAIYKQISIQ
ncbi:MAG: CgeB family protein [Verrucomicrobiales bacterium]